MTFVQFMKNSIFYSSISFVKCATGHEGDRYGCLQVLLEYDDNLELS